MALMKLFSTMHFTTSIMYFADRFELTTQLYICIIHKLMYGKVTLAEKVCTIVSSVNQLDR